MTKWNKEEYKQQFPSEKNQKEFAIEMQTRLYEECGDPIQKERYKKGLEILKRESESKTSG